MSFPSCRGLIPETLVTMLVTRGAPPSTKSDSILALPQLIGNRPFGEMVNSMGPQHTRFRGPHDTLGFESQAWVRFELALVPFAQLPAKGSLDLDADSNRAQARDWNPKVSLNRECRGPKERAGRPV